MYKSFFKRLIDFLTSLLSIIIFIPVIILVFILLLLVNKGNPFFIQKRPGKREKLFKLIKFKTMTDEKDENGNLLSDEQRLTKIGEFIRETSLDELPQLINVLKGDMSLIGPRPLLPQYLHLYNEEQKRRHEVRPGITGWAQINGRNSISWNEKFKLDVYYVDNISFLLDMKIIFLTIQKVFKREGISKEGMKTTEAFNGRN
ncbi:sugar transferase [Joostella atrarenae]|uniref:Sugar transferase n=1 Tax=Joostella atrarenae TaxID=679257 RepID=A0ABS9J3B6_9FLAO|nr:sugar transferase [Joostella atrarenae]MCF8714884.1 sugar transferase [Joostella atrarenae]